jgi:hypothetical protein
MILVVRDSDGDAWVYIGKGRWVQPAEIQRGEKYVEQWAIDGDDLEASYGPLVTEWAASEER